MIDLQAELQEKSLLIAYYILNSPFKSQITPKYIADAVITERKSFQTVELGLNLKQIQKMFFG